jgi:NitT/TauT family transport system substrate-binding protein
MAPKIRVGHSSHGAGNAPMALGVGEGYFRDAGLDVEMVEMPRTGDAVKKLVANEIEFVVVGAVPIITAARAGHDPLIVMSIEAENVFGVVGSKAIKKPDDIRGTRVAISGKREQDEMMIRRALGEWGIDPDKEVTLEVRGSRGKCWEAVVSGECSIMTATIPQPIHARAMGLPVLKDYAELHEPYQAGAVVTTRRYADANPDAVKKFLGAQLRAVRAFQKDFDLALPYLRQRSKIDDIGVLRETQKLFGHAAEDYVPNPAAFGNVLKNLLRIYGEKIDIDVNAIVEPAYAVSLEGRKPYPAFAG